MLHMVSVYIITTVADVTELDIPTERFPGKELSPRLFYTYATCARQVYVVME